MSACCAVQDRGHVVHSSGGKRMMRDHWVCRWSVVWLAGGMFGAPVAMAADAGPGDKPATVQAAKTTAEEKKSAGVAPADAGSTDEVTIVVGGMPELGRLILPASETEFRFKLSDTGDVLTLRWANLGEYERNRVMKICGLQVVEDQKVFGGKVAGIRYHLRSGKTYDAFPLPERSGKGQVAFRTATMPLLIIPEAEVLSQEPFEAYESQFFSPRELYERWLLEKPPGHDDAAAHLEFARKAADMGLCKEALDHLAAASIIDPRTEERNKEMRQQLLTDLADRQTQELYVQLLRETQIKEYFAALDILDRLDRNFPNSPLKSRWDSVRDEVAKGTQSQLARRVVQMAYAVCDDLIQQRQSKKTGLDEKGNPVESIPGKQVSTKQGHLFRGTLVSPDAAGDLVLKVENTTLTIRAKDILSVLDVDLAQSATQVAPAFDTLKSYVSGSGPEDLKGEMIARICQVLKQPKAKVQEIFDNRLAKTAVYEGGRLTSTDIYATNHSAAYGVGSWLREGSKPGPVPENDAQNGLANSPFAPGTQGWRQAQQQQAQQQKDDPMDDPNSWWLAQTGDTQLAVLRAIAAEKVFTVKQITKVNCPNCGGTGYLTIHGGSSPTLARCPVCRAIGYNKNGVGPYGYLFKITYW